MKLLLFAQSREDSYSGLCFDMFFQEALGTVHYYLRCDTGKRFRCGTSDIGRDIKRSSFIYKVPV